ncbi:dapdiamide synthesis protein DdaC-like [Clytia hemisphaerica]|uniref:TauD/TfdA-like domain-containing protein n=1 Tax=Clytia hemisphaerica TaxID=252671 RepID=A0A7M5XCX4_9CNID
MLVRRITGKQFKTTFPTRTIFTELEQKELNQPRIKCRNRPYLAGAKSDKFPEYISMSVNKYFSGIKLKDPKNTPHMKDIALEFRKHIDENLKTHSAFLLKGLPTNGVDEIQDFISGMEYKSFYYDAGNAARSSVGEYLYTASDEPKDVSIEPHNEMAYLETFPSKIMFYCASAADYGGDSPVVFNRDIKKSLDTSDVYEKMNKKKIRYIRNLSHEKNSPYLTWQETFKTKSEEKAEKVMQRENMDWEWQHNGDLSLWNTVSATTQHPVTKEEIWFNQVTAAHSSYYKDMSINVNNQHLPANQFPLHTCYGDGEEITDEEVDEIRSATWSNAMSLKLQPGDVLLLDNLLALHSRMSYEGGERKILVNLSY